MNYTESLSPCKAEIKNILPASVAILFFVIGCSIGIDIHSKCEAAKADGTYNNLREALNYSLTIGITTMITLIALRMMKGNATAIGLLFSVIGVITGGMTLGMFYKCANEVSGDRKKSLEGFAWLSLVMMFLTGGYSAMMLRK